MKFKSGKILVAVMATLAIGLLFIEPSFAGTDTTFGSANTAGSGPVYTLTNWMKGSLGVLISIIALAVAVISAIGGKLTQVAVAIGVAIAVQVGPSVLSGMFTATLPAIV